MATGGCAEKEVDCIPREEYTNTTSDKGGNKHSPESEPEEEMRKTRSKRLQSFDTNNQKPTGSNRKRKVTFSSDSTAKSLTSVDEQLISSNADIAQLQKNIATLLDLLQDKYEEKLANILEQKEAEWAAEKKCLENKILDESVRIENLEQKLSEAYCILRRSSNYPNGVTDAAEKITIGGKKAISCNQNFLSNECCG